MFKIVKLSIILIVICFLNSCKIADLSQKTNLTSTESEKIATEKLSETIKAQGFNFLKEHNLYNVKVEDHWKGVLGKMVKIWPDTKTQFDFKFNFNTFDGSAKFLSGKKEQDIIGVQSWKFYEKTKNSSDYLNKDTGEKKNNMEFGIVVLHYFMELPYRLLNAPIKRYYGQKEKNGETYDLIFASWDQETPNKKYDQYILWINTNTKLVDYCLYTLRTNTNPLTRNMYGSIAFLDYKAVDGFKYATRMPIFLNDGVLTQKDYKKYFHQFSINKFNFGSFDETELYPLKNLTKKIDSK